MSESPLPRKRRAKKIIIGTAIVLIVLFIGMLAAIPYMVMPSFLGQRFEQKQYDSMADFSLPSEEITLKTDDDLSLAAWRTRAKDAKGTVIILSGIQNPSVTAFFGYAKMLADNNWDSLLIEMRARSKSKGDEIGFGMTEWLDVKAGVDYLNNDPATKDLPIVTMGTSMGAGTVIIAAGELPEVDAVISISGFSAWSNLFAYYMGESGVPEAISTMDIPFVNLYMGLHFGFDRLQYSPINGIKKLGDRPILLMHSTQDSQVPFSEFERLRDAASQNNIRVTPFIREGDEHFVCYEKYFLQPTNDIEFSQTVFDFLRVNFP